MKFAAQYAVSVNSENKTCFRLCWKGNRTKIVGKSQLNVAGVHRDSGIPRFNLHLTHKFPLQPCPNQNEDLKVIKRDLGRGLCWINPRL